MRRFRIVQCGEGSSLTRATFSTGTGLAGSAGIRAQLFECDPVLPDGSQAKCNLRSKARTNESANPALALMDKVFLALISAALVTLIGALVFAAFTL
jgi:hypothetical protein